MGEDEGVEPLGVHQLQPCHIELHTGTASPLPGFQEDETDGPAVAPLPLEGLHEPALGPVEPEKDILTATFAFYIGARGRPEREIITAADAVEVFSRLTDGNLGDTLAFVHQPTVERTGLYDGGHCRIGRHLLRNPYPLRLQTAYAGHYPRSVGGVSGQRVITPCHQGKPAGVLGNHLLRAHACPLPPERRRSRPTR